MLLNWKYWHRSNRQHWNSNDNSGGGVYHHWKLKNGQGTIVTVTTIRKSDMAAKIENIYISRMVTDGPKLQIYQIWDSE